MQEISDWLKRIGLGQYAHCFAENDIDFSILRDLTDQDLEKIGVQSLGHRRKVLRAIAELKGVENSAPELPAAAAVPVALRPHDAAERRQVTVMFCDLVGSTALSGRLDPEDLRGIIRAYHHCCTELVERDGGFVAKYMGDAFWRISAIPGPTSMTPSAPSRLGLPWSKLYRSSRPPPVFLWRCELV
jgi:hypothetical protein